MASEDKGDGKTNPVQNWMKTKETGLGVGQWSGDKGRTPAGGAMVSLSCTLEERHFVLNGLVTETASDTTGLSLPP